MAEADMNARLTPDLERTLRRYVLGDLAEEVRSELEELLVTDQDSFEALGVVEDELLEEYLDGTGTEADRLAFEQHFLTTPQREVRLRFARALRARASLGTAAGPLRSPGPVVRSVRWRPAWIGLAAALAVSLAGNVWLASRHRSPAEAEGRSTPVATIEAKTAAGDSAARHRELQDELERERSERSRAEARATMLAEALRRSRTRVATFALAAGVLRAGGSIQRLTVPPDAIVVRLRLELAGDDYPLYRAGLLDAEGDEVWAVSELKTEVGAGETTIMLALPAALLPRGDYQVKLSGVSEGGEPEAVGTYAFRVSTP